MIEEKLVEVNGLDLKLRSCKIEDQGFIYELMRNYLGKYFNSIPEGWSRQKFREGFFIERITIIEHNEMPIGFFDQEVKK